MNDENSIVPAVKVSSVSKGYGKGSARTDVLRSLSLELPAGAFDVAMGASGCGKSTLLHVVAGLIAPDSGKVEIAGREVSTMSDGAATRFRRRHVGVVFQSFNLVESLSVAENIELPVRLDRARPDRDRLDFLLRRLGIADKRNRRPQELSGGERQRVAIARALFTKPDVILADEPTGNLDVAAAHGICTLLRELHAEEKCSILLVTHDPVVAACAGRVHFLKDGAIAATFPTDGDPATVSARYLEFYR